MTNIDPAIAARLGRQAASTAHAARIFLASGEAIGLTDHDRDLAFGGVIHRAQPGMTLTDLRFTADLAPDHGAIVTVLHPNGLMQDHLDRSDLQGARIEIDRVDTEDMASRFTLAIGTVGEVDVEASEVVIEFRGPSEALAASIGRVYQRTCDARLGDGRCGVDLSLPAHRATGIVGVADGLTFTVSVTTSIPPLSFVNGTLGLISGPLGGLVRPIRVARADPSGVECVLWEGFPLPVQAGTSAELTVGCDRTFETCRSRFGNARRFGGFPTIPGTDVLAIGAGRWS